MPTITATVARYRTATVGRLARHRQTITAAGTLGRIPTPAAILAWILGGAAASLLSDWVSTHRGAGIIIIGVGGALLTTTALRTGAALRNTIAAAEDAGIPGEHAMATRRGLIALVGLDAANPNGDLALVLGTADRLERVALIGTVETATRGIDAAVVDTLLPACGHRLPAGAVRTWAGTAAQSMADHVDAVTAAIDWMRRAGIDGADLVVDLTGGRKSAVLGAGLAAWSHQVESQLVDDAWNTATDSPIPGRRGIKIVAPLHSEPAT